MSEHPFVEAAARVALEMMRAERDALAVEVSLLRAALAPEHGVSCQVCLECTGCGHEQDCALAAALAAPASAGGEHGSALIEAVYAMAKRLNRLSLEAHFSSHHTGDHDVCTRPSCLSNRDLMTTWRLRGASAASGQGAGDKGGEREPHKNDADFLELIW